MPYQDGTGPWGTGPIGFGFGPCHTNMRYQPRSYKNWGYWNGHHGGHGCCSLGNYPTFIIPPVELENYPEEEKKIISQELEFIEERKENLTKRLDELNSTTK